MSRQSYIYSTTTTTGTETFAPGKVGYVLKITKMVFTNPSAAWSLSLQLSDQATTNILFTFTLTKGDVHNDTTEWDIGANQVMSVKCTTGTNIYVVGYYEKL